MKHAPGTFLLFVFLALSAGLFAQTAPQPAQAKPTEKEKIYEEIAGDYAFDVGGSQTQTIAFVIKDGALYGASIGETLKLLVPVKGKPLHFEATVESNGNFFEFDFVRDDKGAIFKCVLQTEGMTVEGFKTLKRG